MKEPLLFLFFSMYAYNISKKMLVYLKYFIEFCIRVVHTLTET